MSVRTEQKCDKCGKTRPIEPNARNMTTLNDARQHGGWRILSTSGAEKDICDTCIADFLIGT